MCYFVLVSATTYYHVLLGPILGAATRYQSLPGTTAYCLAPLCTTAHYCCTLLRILGTTSYYSVLLDTTRCDEVLFQVPLRTTYYQVLLHTTMYYQVLLRTTRYYCVRLRLILGISTTSTSRYYEVLRCATTYYSVLYVLPGTMKSYYRYRCYQVLFGILLRTATYQQNLLRTTRYYQVLLGTTGCYYVLLGTILGSTSYYHIPLGFTTTYYLVLLGTTTYYFVLLRTAT